MHNLTITLPTKPESKKNFSKFQSKYSPNSPTSSNPITQVNPDETQKRRHSGLVGLYSCLSVVRKCFIRPDRSKQNMCLLGPQPKHFNGRKTLVLDLDETLVHSSYAYTRNPDFVLPIRSSGVTHMIHIQKRPGVDKFLTKVSELFEVVVFTASIEEYARPLMKKLDKENKVSSLLFREACTMDNNGNFIKDLSKLGRDLKKVILIDNATKSFEFQPENAYHIKDFFDDKSDNELERLLPFLEYLAREAEDVRPIASHQKNFNKKILAKQKSPSLANQEQFSPDAKVSKVQIKKKFKRREARRETEKESLNLDVSIEKDSPQEEVEALKVIRNLSLRRTILKNQLKTLDKSALGITLNNTGGSACTACTASPSDKNDSASASIQTPEFAFAQKLDHFADTPKDGEDDRQQPPVEQSQGMLSRILEFAEMKKQEYERFDSESDECERKVTVTETGGEGTMQELLFKEESNDVTFQVNSLKEIKGEEEPCYKAVKC